MTVPADRMYSQEHEWVKVENGVATVGITEHAQDQLGDIVFVDLPTEGAEFEKGDEAIALESAKAAASVYAPANGEIVEANEELADQPELVNDDCYEAGWMFKIKFEGEIEGLMDSAAYEKFLAENE